MATVRDLLWVAVLWLGASAAGHADSGLARIHAALGAGHLASAERMLEARLKRHPEDAQAHYLQAEVDARQGKLAAGREALAAAEVLQPDLPFATSAAVDALRRSVAGAPRPHPLRDHFKLAAALLTAVGLVVALRRHSEPLRSAARDGLRAGRRGHAAEPAPPRTYELTGEEEMDARDFGLGDASDPPPRAGRDRSHARHGSQATAKPG
ncbi:MAG: hypothetical protein AB7I01_13340 [Gammaproteobacteria bacterium]